MPQDLEFIPEPIYENRRLRQHGDDERDQDQRRNRWSEGHQLAATTVRAHRAQAGPAASLHKVFGPITAEAKRAVERPAIDPTTLSKEENNGAMIDLTKDKTYGVMLVGVPKDPPNRGVGSGPRQQ